VPAGEEGDAFATDLGARLAASEPQVLLNERLRDALTERVAELEGMAEPVDGAATAAEPGFRFHPAALANSRLLSYAGWGHTAYGRNDCTTAHVDAYLVDGALPRVGMVCRANPNPFLSPPAALTALSDHVAGAPPGWLLRPEP
jgi:TAP-like protein